MMKGRNIQLLKKASFFLYKIAITFLGIVVLSLTLGQIIPIELKDHSIRNCFYTSLIVGAPIAILLTLPRNLTGKKNIFSQITIAIATILGSTLSFFLVLAVIFQVGAGSWTTFSILYRHRTADKEIRHQKYDVGALGYGGDRIVKTSNLLRYWTLAVPIDTANISTKEWKFVNEQGDVTFP